jgi:hypothetical protein
MENKDVSKFVTGDRVEVRMNGESAEWNESRKRFHRHGYPNIGNKGTIIERLKFDVNAYTGLNTLYRVKWDRWARRGERAFEWMLEHVKEPTTVRDAVKEAVRLMA